MAEKNIKSRIVHKHDLESNWLLATNFTPKQGELIVYDIDENYSYERIKIGDGIQNVNDLPFIDKGIKDWIDENFLNKNDAIPVIHIEGVDTVIWTGNEEAVDVGALKPYYYISDATPTVDDCANGIYINIIDDMPFYFPAEALFVDDDGVIHAEQEDLIIVNSNCVGKEIESMGDYLVFPYAGIYVYEKFFGHIDSLVIPGYTGFGARKFIDPKYMPSNIRVTNIDLLSANWIGESNPYSQVVEINGVTENSQVDLTPSVAQLVVFHDKDLGFVTENDDGVVTVYAIGQKPLDDYTIQVTITEVGV